MRGVQLRWAEQFSICVLSIAYTLIVLNNVIIGKWIRLLTH